MPTVPARRCDRWRSTSTGASVRAPGQEPQQVPGRLVGPVQVLEHHHQRPGPAGSLPEPGHRLEQLQPERHPAHAAGRSDPGSRTPSPTRLAPAHSSTWSRPCRSISSRKAPTIGAYGSPSPPSGTHCPRMICAFDRPARVDGSCTNASTTVVLPDPGVAADQREPNSPRPARCPAAPAVGPTRPLGRPAPSTGSEPPPTRHRTAATAPIRGGRCLTTVFIVPPTADTAESLSRRPDHLSTAAAQQGESPAATAAVGRCREDLLDGTASAAPTSGAAAARPNRARRASAIPAPPRSAARRDAARPADRSRTGCSSGLPP